MPLSSISRQIFLAAGLSAISLTVYGKADRLKVGIELPYINSENRLTIDLYYNTDLSVNDTVFIRCYKYNNALDSILIYRKEGVAINLESGVHKRSFDLSRNESGTWFLPLYYNMLKKTGTVPPGSYKTFVRIQEAVVDSTLGGKILPPGNPYARIFTIQADSSISAASSIKKELNNTLIPENKPGIVGKLLGQTSMTTSSQSASKAIERGSRRINRLFQRRGLSQRVEQRLGKTFINLYYENWFAGRYEMDATVSVADQIKKQEAQLTGNVSSLATNELGSYKSIFSQIRELTKNAKDDKGLNGELALTGVAGTGQPEYSAEDKNYYEVRGRVETEIADIPVGIEGYYTSQDGHRLVKSSYIHVHYDAEKAKAGLMKLITGYRDQFSQTLAKGKGLNNVYGSYLNGLESRKGALIADMAKEAGISGGRINGMDANSLKGEIIASLSERIKDTGALLDSAGIKLDSAGHARKALARTRLIEDSANHLYERAQRRYKQIQDLEGQVTKYRNLLDQYANTVYFDSSLAYDKVKNLKSGDETTYRQMAKSASGLLPDGKAKKFISGLTSLDAGIFPKYVSKYSMAGQQLKGLDVGYDVGFAQIGITLGKTDYAGRDGSLDKYTAYSTRVLFTPLKGQKIGLVYYGYTPSRSALSADTFYRNLDISLPSFTNPVHIVSATYEGNIAKTVTLDGEMATSFREGSGQTFKNGLDADRLAWHLNAEGQIPKTGLTVTGSYEHGGKEFQNSTLPMMIAGADLYKAGAKGDFFRGFLSLGAEYNHMQQSSFYSTGGNNRWGFSIATLSKQYPSVTLSYKPFETFRSYADTLTVQQRPLLGAVWSGKASYQIKKRGGESWRFNVLFNRSTSSMDSIRYSSDLLQLSTIYTSKKIMAIFTTGQSNMSSGSGDTLFPAHVRTTFGAGSLGYGFSKTTNVSGGADIGVAPYGLSKVGLNAGLSYKLKTAPLTIRTTGRYSAYKLEGYSGETKADGSTGTVDGGSTNPLTWRKVLGCSLDLIWQFEVKLKD